MYQVKIQTCLHNNDINIFFYHPAHDDALDLRSKQNRLHLVRPNASFRRHDSWNNLAIDLRFNLARRSPAEYLHFEGWARVEASLVPSNWFFSANLSRVDHNFLPLREA